MKFLKRFAVVLVMLVAISSVSLIGVRAQCIDSVGAGNCAEMEHRPKHHRAPPSIWTLLNTELNVLRSFRLL